MAKVEQLFRNKRFSVNASCKLWLVFETNTGERLKAQIKNLSINGMGSTIENFNLGPDLLTEGSIIPSSKIVIEDGNQEVTLGRLVLRRCTQKENGSLDLAFSTIDIRIPVAGSLSKFLTEKNIAEKANAMELSSDKFSLGNFIGTDSDSADIFSKATSFSTFLREWKETPKYQYKTYRKNSKGTRINLTTPRKGGKRSDYLMFASNDYLGLSCHPEVVEAAKTALDLYGFGSTGSPVTTGNSAIHEELCDYVAKLFRKEKAILFNSGYAANLGILSCLAGPQDLIVADLLCHASIHDGLSMSKATHRLFKHNDYKSLAKILEEHRSNFNGLLTVTEGVFSMDGDTPNLEAISNETIKAGGRLMVDEAHSFGVIGPTGLGSWEMFPEAKVDLIMGTFSKIAGAIGGFVAGPKEVMDYLYHLSRAHLFSVSIPPSTAAAALTALKIFSRDSSLVSNLQRNIRHFCNGLRDLGYPIKNDHQSAVVPLVIRDEKKMAIMNEILREDGVFVVPIIFPAVSKTNCRFRFTIMATHTPSEIDYTLEIVAKALNAADVRFAQPEDELNSGATKKAA